MAGNPLIFGLVSRYRRHGKTRLSASLLVFLLYYQEETGAVCSQASLLLEWKVPS
jgi:hypothetical protein